MKEYPQDYFCNYHSCTPLLACGVSGIRGYSTVKAKLI